MNQKTKITLAACIAIVIIASSLVVVFSENLTGRGDVNKLARVACMGDSITQITDYPMDLQILLGSNSKIGDFGSTGSSVNFNTSNTYYFQEAFMEARNFDPTTVIIMLGTNDARSDNYPQIGRFVGDYEHMLTRIENFSSKPQIFIVLPPPIYSNHLNLSETNFEQGVLPKIQQVATAMNLTLIDCYTPLLNHPEYFSDGVHPDPQGSQIIANVIYKAIKSSS